MKRYPTTVDTQNDSVASRTSLRHAYAGLKNGADSYIGDDPDDEPEDNPRNTPDEYPYHGEPIDDEPFDGDPVDDLPFDGDPVDDEIDEF